MIATEGRITLTVKQVAGDSLLFIFDGASCNYRGNDVFTST